MNDPAYDQAWARLRSRVRLLRIAEALWLLPVAVFAVGIVGFELVPNTLDWRGPLWFSFLALLGAAVGLRLLANRGMRSFACPRCAKPFFNLTRLRSAPLSALERRYPCQHCNLPVGAASGDD
jgi:hypothetical protein